MSEGDRTRREAPQDRGSGAPSPERPWRVGDFSLQNVCWGYRDVFQKTIDHLFAEGYLGPSHREVTDKFFELLGSSKKTGFDHVLKEFLKALNPRTRWIVELPEVFADVADLGRQFAEPKIWHGTTYFSLLGEGRFGGNPGQIRNLMMHLRRLRNIDEDLAIAFLKGYGRLVESLRPVEIERYIEQGLAIHANNPSAAAAFMEGTAKGSDTAIRGLTRECRLEDVRAALERLLRALVGYEVQVADFGGLDSDELIERGSRVVCMYRWLYLPSRIRQFEDARRNRSWYVLTAVAAAGMLSEDAFPRIHGHRDYANCRALVGDGMLELNVFQILEFARVLRRIAEMWPGARGLLDFALATEFGVVPPASPADRLFAEVTASGPCADPAAETVRRAADGCGNCFEAASRLREGWVDEVAAAYPGLGSLPLRTFGFLPDMLFTGEASSPPSDSLVADLKRNASRERTKRDTESQAADAAADEGGDGSSASEEDGGPGRAVPSCFVYDEWSQTENDYYRDYCLVYEKRPEACGARAVPAELLHNAADVRRVFEQIKPEVTRRQRYLPDGDSINSDLLTDYIVNRRRDPSPKVLFYEKPTTRERDLAVLILLDVSGSTAEEVERTKVIEIEKEAGLILGEGLAALGDRFSICGFSGNGRENCEYHVYKDFDDGWDEEARDKVLSAYPSSSTRIGPALRHSGWRLSRVEAKTRLIILVTDGKPMDSGYDPGTGYAQHDVRMACEENGRQSVHTFCISTDENSRADMGTMFPGRRYAILADIRELPRILPRLYVRMTAN
jgi:hypothetical protein